MVLSQPLSRLTVPFTDDICFASAGSHSGPVAETFILTESLCVRRTRKGSSFCGGGLSSAFELGGIGEPLKVSSVRFKHALTSSRIHIKLQCRLAALLAFRAQFAVGQN